LEREHVTHVDIEVDAIAMDKAEQTNVNNEYHIGMHLEVEGIADNVGSSSSEAILQQQHRQTPVMWSKISEQDADINTLVERVQQSETGLVEESDDMDDGNDMMNGERILFVNAQVISQLCIAINRHSSEADLMVFNLPAPDTKMQQISRGESRITSLCKQPLTW
jgi:hypothetical protein